MRPYYRDAIFVFILICIVTCIFPFIVSNQSWTQFPCNITSMDTIFMCQRLLGGHYLLRRKITVNGDNIAELRCLSDNWCLECVEEYKNVTDTLCYMKNDKIIVGSHYDTDFTSYLTDSIAIYSGETIWLKSDE